MKESLLKNKYLIIAIGLIVGLIFYAGYQFNTNLELETENELLNYKLEEFDKSTFTKDSMITQNSILLYQLYKEIDSLKIPNEKIEATADTIHVFSTHVSAIADSIIALYE